MSFMTFRSHAGARHLLGVHNHWNRPELRGGLLRALRWRNTARYPALTATHHVPATGFMILSLSRLLHIGCPPITSLGLVFQGAREIGSLAMGTNDQAIAFSGRPSYKVRVSGTSAVQSVSSKGWRLWGFRPIPFSIPAMLNCQPFSNNGGRDCHAL